MALNIVDSIVGQLSTDQVESVSRATGHDPARTRGTISTSVVTILEHLVERGSTTTGAHNLETTLRSSGSTASVVSGLLGEGTAAEDLTDSVAARSGIDLAAAAGILSMLLPPVATVLRREVVSRDLDGPRLVNLLRSVPGMPAGIVAPEERPVAVPRHDVRRPELQEEEAAVRENIRLAEVPVRTQPKNAPYSWLPFALMLGVLGALGVILWNRGRHERAVDTRSETTLTGAEVARGDLEGHFSRQQLPDVIPLSNVGFATGGTRLVSGADTIDELADLMKQHPTTRIRVEGHPDTPGDPKANEALAMERATTIKHQLIERGVAPARIHAVGRPDVKREAVRGQPTSRVDAVIVAR